MWNDGDAPSEVRLNIDQNPRNDLRVYAQASDAQVLHYKDNTDLAVDAIIETADGTLARVRDQARHWSRR